MDLQPKCTDSITCRDRTVAEEWQLATRHALLHQTALLSQSCTKTGAHSMAAAASNRLHVPLRRLSSGSGWPYTSGHSKGAWRASNTLKAGAVLTLMCRRTWRQLVRCAQGALQECQDLVVDVTGVPHPHLEAVLSHWGLIYCHHLLLLPLLGTSTLCWSSQGLHNFSSRLQQHWVQASLPVPLPHCSSWKTPQWI